MWNIIIQIYAAGLTIALTSGAACPSDYTETSGYCYNILPAATFTWDDAESTCVTRGGHLMVETSAEEHAAFVKYRSSQKLASEPLWIGVQAELTDYIWGFLGDNSAASSTIYENWQTSRPLAYLGMCAVTSEYNMTQKWNVSDCSFSLPYICEISPTGPKGATPTCPTAYTDADGTSKYCYRLVTGSDQPWEQAKAACINSGGRMLIETSAEEHNAFLVYSQNLPSKVGAVWIGAYVKPKLYWTWAGGVGKNRTTLPFENWQNGVKVVPVADQCVATIGSDTAQAWQNFNCSESHPFVCKGTPMNSTNSRDNYTTISAQSSRGWVKVYQNSTFQLPGLVVTPNGTRTNTLVACAVTCTAVTGCGAFNHQRENNLCQFIMGKVDGSHVSPDDAWDVWIDTNSKA